MIAGILRGDIPREDDDRETPHGTSRRADARAIRPRSVHLGRLIRQATPCRNEYLLTSPIACLERHEGRSAP